MKSTDQEEVNVRGFENRCSKPVLSLALEDLYLLLERMVGGLDILVHHAEDPSEKVDLRFGLGCIPKIFLPLETLIEDFMDMLKLLDTVFEETGESRPLIDQLLEIQSAEIREVNTKFKKMLEKKSHDDK